MALRDKIVVNLDQSVPPKQRILTVEATSPGGTVAVVGTDTGLVEVREQTRKGKIMNWKRVNPDHVVSIENRAG